MASSVVMAMSRREFARGLGGRARAARGRTACSRRPTSCHEAQERALRAAVRGRVPVPGERATTRARVVFNRRYDGVRPPAVVQVATRPTCAPRPLGRPLRRPARRALGRPRVQRRLDERRPRSWSTSARLDRIRLADGVATIGPGARLGDVYAALAARASTVPAGSCPTVASAGSPSAAGWGSPAARSASRSTACASIDVVTATGERRRVAGDDDLFWALRGGGGSFGDRHRVPPPHPPRRPRRVLPHRLSARRTRGGARRTGTRSRRGAPRELTAILTLTAAARAPSASTSAPSRAAAAVAPLTRRGASSAPARRLPRPPAPLGGLRRRGSRTSTCAAFALVRLRRRTGSARPAGARSWRPPTPARR